MVLEGGKEYGPMCFKASRQGVNVSVAVLYTHQYERGKVNHDKKRVGFVPL